LQRIRHKNDIGSKYKANNKGVKREMGVRKRTEIEVKRKERKLNRSEKIERQKKEGKGICPKDREI
jgi:hypothetical protein